jgi:hypothetical protein
VDKGEVVVEEEDKVLVGEHTQNNLCHKCSFGVLYHQGSNHIEFQHTHLLLEPVVEVVTI